GSIILWDFVTGTELRSLANPDRAVSQIVFSPDGTFLASAGGTVVRLWKVATGQLVFTARDPANATVWCVAFSPAGKTLAYGQESGEVRLWEVATGRERARLSGHGGRVRWIGFHPDGLSLAVAGAFPDNIVYIWDLTTRTRRYRLSGHGSEVLSGAW